MADVNQTISDRWNRHELDSVPVRPRWWKAQPIWRHINRRSYGIDSPDKMAFHDFLAARLALPPESLGLSIACGKAAKELNLLRMGVVGAFDLCDLSTVRRDRALEAARAEGLADRVTFSTDDPFTSQPVARYDLIYWHAALHHMMDVPKAVAWCRRALKPGGRFVFNEYVGPNRFQWSQDDIALANEVRASIPASLVAKAAARGYAVPKTVHCPTEAQVMGKDPSESVDSARILPSVLQSFATRDIQHLGGVIFMLAIGDVASFVRSPAERQWLAGWLDRDAALAKSGRSMFASGICSDPHPDPSA